MAERERHVARGVYHTTPVFVARAHGALLEDVDGNTLIDFASGIGVVNVGHTPARVVAGICARYAYRTSTVVALVSVIQSNAPAASSDSAHCLLARSSP